MAVKTEIKHIILVRCVCSGGSWQDRCGQHWHRQLVCVVRHQRDIQLNAVGDRSRSQHSRRLAVGSSSARHSSQHHQRRSTELRILRQASGNYCGWLKFRFQFRVQRAENDNRSVYWYLYVKAFFNERSNVCSVFMG